MRVFASHLILFIAILALPMGYIWLKPLDKNFAFDYVKDDCYNHGRWIENRIKNTHDSIDWIFIGSSHTIHAIVDYRLQDSIKTKTGVNVNIASFGYCRTGQDIWYEFFKDLLKYQHPKRLFLEVACRLEDINHSHIDLGYTANWKEILTVPFTNDDTNYIDNIKKALVIRTEAFKYNVFNTYKLPPPDNAKWGYIPDVTHVEDPKVLSDREDGLRQYIQSAVTDSDSYRRQFRFIVIYYKRIFKLAKEYNIPITFYYIPVYSAPHQPLDTTFFTIRGNLLLPPDYISKNKVDWMDINHLNNSGAYQYTDWILTQCIPLVKRDIK